MKKSPTFLDLLNILSDPDSDEALVAEARKRVWEKVVTKQVTRQEFNQLLDGIETRVREEVRLAREER
jgi:hypothetical protein